MVLRVRGAQAETRKERGSGPDGPEAILARVARLAVALAVPRIEAPAVVLQQVAHVGHVRNVEAAHDGEEVLQVVLRPRLDS